MPSDPTSTPPFVDALVQLSFAVQAVLARAAAEHDLSVVQLRMLGLLRDRTPAMAAIAEHLGLDRSSVTGLVDRAAVRGLVVRVPSPDDARVTTVSLTPAGREVGAALATAVSRDVRMLGSRLSKKQRTLVVDLAVEMLRRP